MFDSFLHAATERGAEFVPLGALLDEEDPSRTIATGVMAAGSVAGREGSVACLTA
jgi:hypothetical protein